METVSIIIPSLNSTLIDQVCEAIRCQTYDQSRIEVIIVGIDEKGIIPIDTQITFIPTDRLTNAAKNRNIGISRASGDIFVFLDSDCLPRPDWLIAHLTRHRRGEKVVGGAVELPPGGRWQLADNVSAFHDLLPHTEEGPRPYLATANLSMRREVIEDIGSMNPELRYAHDLEWTVRMRKKGYSLYFEPRAVVLHDPPRNTPRAVWRHWYDDAPYTLLVRVAEASWLDTPGLARYRLSYLAGAPLIALWATCYTFSHPVTRNAYWHTSPLVYFTKLIWCLGALFRFPGKFELPR